MYRLPNHLLIDFLSVCKFTNPAHVQRQDTTFLRSKEQGSKQF